MPGYQADNTEEKNMATRLISREPKDPQFVSLFLLYSRNMSLYLTRSSYSKTRRNFIKELNCFSPYLFAENCTKRPWKTCPLSTRAFATSGDSAFLLSMHKQVSPWTTAIYGSANSNEDPAKLHIIFTATQPRGGEKRNDLPLQNAQVKSKPPKLKVKSGGGVGGGLGGGVGVIHVATLPAVVIVRKKRFSQNFCHLWSRERLVAGIQANLGL